MGTTPAVVWRGCEFIDLTLLELQFIYMARQQVFGVEQQCAYLDVDGLDAQAFHLAAWPGAHGMGREPAYDTTQRAVHGMPLAYARVLSPGVKYAEPAIGRVLTTQAGRGAGLGRELMQRAVAHAVAAFPGQGLRISAQSYLTGFYQSLGFVPVGRDYLEDGIPHSEMWRPG
jgi:ElaA protein